MTSHYLTKTLFVEGMNCPGLMWYRVHDHDCLSKPGLFDQVVMKHGVEIGKLARKLYPSGVLLNDQDGSKTYELLLQKVPLFEATFVQERLLCKVDLLLPNGDGSYTIVEVKSSTEVDNDHLLDVAFQTHVLIKTGLNVKNAFVCHVNSQYVKEGELNVQEFFTLTNVTESIQPLLINMDASISRLLSIMDGSVPDLPLGRHCKNKTCPLNAVTFTGLPPDNVTELYYQNGEKFIKQGILKITDIKDGIGLNAKQFVQWKALKTGAIQIDKQPLSEWLSKLEYPLAHFDFETLNPAIPRWNGTKPYQHVPFQYSMHIEYGDGRVEHREFLNEQQDDPRPALLEQMKQDLASVKTILAHYASFEKSRFLELAQAFPEDAEWLKNLVERLKDTIEPFQSFWYYHPAQHGSCSIKDVLPALTGKSYKDLDISNGTMAQVEYARFIDSPLTAEEHSVLKKQLLDYCGLDTQGMVEILRVLKSAAKE